MTEIERTLFRFFQALDERRYADQVALVADDGTWLRQGKLLTGPEEFRAALEERPADFHTVHLITNMDVELSGDGARASFLGTVFAHRGDVPEGGHPPVTPAQIARYEATLVNSGAGWRIQSLRSTVLAKA